MKADDSQSILIGWNKRVKRNNPKKKISVTRPVTFSKYLAFMRVIIVEQYVDEEKNTMQSNKKYLPTRDTLCKEHGSFSSICSIVHARKFLRVNIQNLLPLVANYELDNKLKMNAGGSSINVRHECHENWYWPHNLRYKSMNKGLMYIKENRKRDHGTY